MANPGSWWASNPIDSEVQSSAFYARPVSAFGVFYYAKKSFFDALSLLVIGTLTSPFFVEDTRLPILSNNPDYVCGVCYKNFEMTISKARETCDATFDFADQIGFPELRQQAGGNLPKFMESYRIKGVALAKKGRCMAGDEQVVDECRSANYIGSAITNYEVVSPYFTVGCVALAALYLYNHWSSRLSVEATITAGLNSKYQNVAELLRARYQDPRYSNQAFEASKGVLENVGNSYKDIAALGLPSLAEVEKQRALVAPVIDQANAIVQNFEEG